jgi:hypothetical protein
LLFILHRLLRVEWVAYTATHACARRYVQCGNTGMGVRFVQSGFFTYKVDLTVSSIVHASVCCHSPPCVSSIALLHGFVVVLVALSSNEDLIERNEYSYSHVRVRCFLLACFSDTWGVQAAKHQRGPVQRAEHSKSRGRHSFIRVKELLRLTRNEEQKVFPLFT